MALDCWGVWRASACVVSRAPVTYGRASITVRNLRRHAARSTIGRREREGGDFEYDGDSRMERVH